jgi:hypothetical protein
MPPVKLGSYPALWKGILMSEAESMDIFLNKSGANLSTEE